MINFKRDSDNLIVAGNGPSLKNIDLNSLPNDFDVFRCNQFYIEDKYYLSKNIKLAMFNPIVVQHQLKTIHEITKNNEYFIENICLNYINDSWDKNFCLNSFKEKMPFVYILKDMLDNKILRELCFFDTFDKLRPTSGVLLMLLGKSLGYKNIYFIGMDFAINANQEQIISIKDSNINSLIYKNMQFCTQSNNEAVHNSHFDLSIIKKYNFTQIQTTHIVPKVETKVNYIKDLILESSISFHNYKDNYKDNKDNCFKSLERNLRRKIKKKLGFKKYQ